MLYNSFSFFITFLYICPLLWTVSKSLSKRWDVTKIQYTTMALPNLPYFAEDILSPRNFSCFKYLLIYVQFSFHMALCLLFHSHHDLNNLNLPPHNHCTSLLLTVICFRLTKNKLDFHLQSSYPRGTKAPKCILLCLISFSSTILNYVPLLNAGYK